MTLNKTVLDCVIDHLMLGAPDLSVGKAWVQGQLGVMAADGGSHPGQGTRNALAGFTDQCYLEVIAPDPAQALKGTLGEQLLGAATPHLRMFAVRCSDFENLARQLVDLGYQYRMSDLSRETIDGTRLSWRLLFVEGHSYGGRMPFFIDWGQSPHPSFGLAQAGTLQQIVVQLSEGHAQYRQLMAVLGLPVVVTEGRPGLRATIQTQLGLIQLS